MRRVFDGSTVGVVLSVEVCLTWSLVVVAVLGVFVRGARPAAIAAKAVALVGTARTLPVVWPGGSWFWVAPPVVVLDEEEVLAAVVGGVTLATLLWEAAGVVLVMQVV